MKTSLRKDRRGIFICFTGIDGSGKTTLALSLANYLNENGIECKRVILFVGQLFKAARKGLDILIKSLPLILRETKNVRLLAVGPGPVNYYRKLAAMLGVEEFVEFVGGVEASLMPRYYNIADVVALPSCKNAEGFGMTLIEAQACGKPVVGTTVGGIPFAVKDGETGLLVHPRDTEGLAKAITTLLNDDALARRLGENGCRRVRVEFTWEQTADKTLEVYRKALDDKA